MLLFALLLVAESPATPVAATQAEMEDKVYCKREITTDSRIRSKKTCRKQSEWDRIAKEAQEDVKRSVNNKSIPMN